MRETTRLTDANIDVFLRRFVKDIPADQLERIPTGRFGASFVFYYGTDKILKVNKVNSRDALLKEARLQAYLSQQDLPISIPAPLQVNSRGLFAVYPRVAGQSLTAEIVADFSDVQMEALARAVGGFLSHLHGPNIPKDVASLVPRGETELEEMVVQAQSWIDFINQHAPDYDTTRFTTGLTRFCGSFVQQWTINHGDLNLSNIMLLDDTPRFAIIDFTDAEECDPSMEFSIMAEDLEDEGLKAKEIVQLVLRHYQSDDGTVEHKMEFRALLREI
jgi:aminoglycoside phosphotransferase (APT) family kinase protein